MVDVADGDVARLEPALHELRRGVKPVGLRRVVGHQPLREGMLVHAAEDTAGREGVCARACSGF